MLPSTAWAGNQHLLGPASPPARPLGQQQRLSHSAAPKSDPLPAPRIPQLRAVSFPRHVPHQTLPGFPLLLSLQSWHCYLSVKNPPTALTSHLCLGCGRFMDAAPVFLPKPADFSDCRGCVLPGSSLTERTWDSPEL